VPQVILNHLAATIAPDHTQPRQGHPVHLHSSCLVGFRSSLLSVRSHVLSSPSNILHLGPSRYSIFRTISFVASKFVLPCYLMGLRTPSDIPVQSDPPTLDNMLIIHTCDFDHARHTHARNIQHASLPSPSSAQTHTMPAIRDAISKLHLKVRKGKIKGPTLRVHCRTAITSPNITGTKPFEAASKVM
jgi:hypothetical protein